MAPRPLGSQFRLRHATAIFAFALVVWTAAAQIATEQETKPAAGPLPLARYFSSQDLVVYLEFDGIDRHDAAWRKTAASRLINDTTTGAMYEAALMSYTCRTSVSARDGNG